MERVYNFSAGPSIMPESVLRTAGAEILNYRGSGMSVMEMSHRSAVFQEIFDSTKAKLRAVLKVPESHEILLLQGGATLQFAAIPMNLIKNGSADYAVTGNFSGKAAKEAEKYGSVHIAADTSATGHDRIPAQSELRLSGNAEYFYYCANNTIYGTEWQYVPETKAALVCDMSSDILTRPVDVSKYGLIYAGAQKNMAPAGVTVVIVREDLLDYAEPAMPTMLAWKTMADNDSMYNTPPCYTIYMLGLVADWLLSIGGLDEMKARNEKKAALLYGYLDSQDYYIAPVRKDSRSMMNVTFVTGNADLDKKFAAEASAAGLKNLKGHRSVGGMRASIYNAMPYEGVEALVAFMKKFAADNPKA